MQRPPKLLILFLPEPSLLVGLPVAERYRGRIGNVCSLSDLSGGPRKEVFGPLRVIMVFPLGRVEFPVRLNEVTVRAGEIAVAIRIDVDD